MENCCHPKGLQRQRRDLLMHSQTSVMSTHHPALAEARSGTGLSPLLAEVFYDKIPDKMEMSQGWPTQLQPGASYDHHTPWWGRLMCSHVPGTDSHQAHPRLVPGQSCNSLALFHPFIVL